MDINVEINSTVIEAQKDSRGSSFPKKDTGICSSNKELLKRKYNFYIHIYSNYSLQLWNIKKSYRRREDKYIQKQTLNA